MKIRKEACFFMMYFVILKQIRTEWKVPRYSVKASVHFSTSPICLEELVDLLNGACIFKSSSRYSFNIPVVSVRELAVCSFFK